MGSSGNFGFDGVYRINFFLQLFRKIQLTCQCGLEVVLCPGPVFILKDLIQRRPQGKNIQGGVITPGEYLCIQNVQVVERKCAGYFRKKPGAVLRTDSDCARIGFLIFGVDSAFLWGFLSVIAAFIPFVGAAIIWVPLVLKMVLEGLIVGNNTMLFMALGLTLYSVFIVGTIDNILKPKIIGDKAGLHPVIVLLGVFGGLALFGFAGLIIGPLLLALFIALLRIYEIEKDSL